MLAMGLAMRLAMKLEWKLSVDFVVRVGRRGVTDQRGAAVPSPGRKHDAPNTSTITLREEKQCVRDKAHRGKAILASGSVGPPRRAAP